MRCFVRFVNEPNIKYLSATSRSKIIVVTFILGYLKNVRTKTVIDICYYFSWGVQESRSILGTKWDYA